MSFRRHFSETLSMVPTTEREMAEHYTYNWSIHNFSVCRHKAGYVIETAEIHPNRDRYNSDSTWRLKLCPRKIKGIRYDGIYLHRTTRNRNHGPTVVVVEFSAAVVEASGKLNFSRFKTLSFNFGDTRGFDDFFRRSELLSSSDQFLPEDTLTLRIEMLVGSDKARRFFEQESLRVESHLRQLSRDIATMYETGFMSDLTVQVGKKAFKCHKAVLSARSPTFAGLIEESDSQGKNVVNVEESTSGSNIIDVLLKYIYSGNISLLMSGGPPPTGLYEAAGSFGLTKLHNFLAPKEIYTDTFLMSKRTQQDIELKGFGEFIEQFCKGRRHLALVRLSTDKNEPWLVRLSVVQSGTQKFLEICVTRQVSGNVVYQVYFKASFLDAQERPYFSTYIFEVFSKYGENSKPWLIPIEHISELQDLKLLCDFRVGNGNYISDISVESRSVEWLSCPPYGVEESHFRTLSNDLKTLCCSNNWTISEEKPLNSVYDCVLLIRSALPVNLLNSLLSSLSSSVAESFVKFMYTGESQLLREHCFSVFSTACKLRLVSLQKKYSIILTNMLTVQNVLYILILASICKEKELKMASLLFIRSHFSELFSRPHWEIFQQRNPSLAKEIFQFIK